MATANRFDLFISPPPDNLKCVICLEVAKTPKQCEDCDPIVCVCDNIALIASEAG